MMGMVFQPPALPPPKPEEVCPEAKDLHAWRFEQLLALDYSAAAAEVLADVIQDLGVPRHLAALGCDPETAFKILA